MVWVGFGSWFRPGGKMCVCGYASLPSIAEEEEEEGNEDGTEQSSLTSVKVERFHDDKASVSMLGWCLAT